jgi:hypothetical protein
MDSNVEAGEPAYGPARRHSEPTWLVVSAAMDLTSYVDNLGREFATIVEAGGDDARPLVERLTGSQESAIRLTLLDALSSAADEITRDLPPGSVELRFRGRDPSFVVTPPPPDQPFEDAIERGPETAYSSTASSEGGPPNLEDGVTARINFRLPEQLKVAIEEAAGKEGHSANAWLVRAASAALQHQANGTLVVKAPKMRALDFLQ